MICFFFPPFDSFLSEPLWDFMDAVHGCRYSFIRKAFPANYSFLGKKEFAGNTLQAAGSSATADLCI